MIEKLGTFKKTDTEKRFAFVKGQANAIMLNIKDLQSNMAVWSPMKILKALTISKKYISDRVHTICTNVDLNVFHEITNEKYGATMGLNARVAKLLDTWKGDGLSVDFDNLFADGYIRIDIGSIDVNHGDELQVVLKLNEQLDEHDKKEIGVYGIGDNNDAYHMVQYDFDDDVNDIHQAISEAYVCDGGNNTVVDIDCDTKQYSTDVCGYKCYMALMGKYEEQDLQEAKVIKVFETDVPEDVHVKIIDGLTETKLLLVRITSQVKK